ncbi:MAG: cyclopentanol dehydrogenase [Rhodospirillaceae bacterium]|nr:cyclopentanol dehydrogenase [Rhodospirillaceae bacterium]|tara:strand:+ start:3505 stop:4251 length:747 start_codon:yes stop_codon:yes gene_type:complete
MRLKNKTALVTGGSQGIGAAVVKRFVKEGASVWFGDVNKKSGNSLVEELSNTGIPVNFEPLDVTSRDQWDFVVSKITADNGKLDILVNNAGIYQRKPLEETTEEEWDRMLAVNTKGPFIGVQASLNALRKSGNASIINLSSVAGLRSSFVVHYGASKGALRLMTKSIANRFAKDGIRCNSVHPGPIDTDMGHNAVPADQLEERLYKRIPLGRFGTADEVANVILFLASDESSFVTGSEFVVDGGATSK